MNCCCLEGYAYLFPYLKLHLLEGATSDEGDKPGGDIDGEVNCGASIEDMGDLSSQGIPGRGWKGKLRN
jgi:hypothetical protein